MRIAMRVSAGRSSTFARRPPSAVATSSASSGIIAGIGSRISTTSATSRRAGGTVPSFDVVPLVKRSTIASKCRRSFARSPCTVSM
jgi:hypothetical protein